MFLHQTTTFYLVTHLHDELFIILFLHQTTTLSGQRQTWLCCLSSCSYIKPQLSDFICTFAMCCLSSCSYIKPQRRSESGYTVGVVYHLVPTSNHNDEDVAQRDVLVVYHLVPTSNHNSSFYVRHTNVVVYHLVPTSNHNYTHWFMVCSLVVYHLVPTSNHNRLPKTSNGQRLFIILFLHQTTTRDAPTFSHSTLFIILFLHQTTTYLFRCE